LVGMELSTSRAFTWNNRSTWRATIWEQWTHTWCPRLLFFQGKTLSKRRASMLIV
jgi:hypothetical protein